MAALVLAVAACGPTEPEKQTVTVSPTSLSFDPDGGSLSVTVTSNGAWYVEVQGNWIKTSISAGSGNGVIEVTVPPNEEEARQGSIAISTADQTASVPVLQGAWPIVAISSVRAMYKGSDVTIPSGTFVKGTVVSNFRSTSNGGLSNYTTKNTLVIQDETGGIQLFCSKENTAFAFGDIVKVDLTDQKLSVYGGTLQVNGLPLEHITKAGSEMNLQIHVMHEDIFNAMHRI